MIFSNSFSFFLSDYRTNLKLKPKHCKMYEFWRINVEFALFGHIFFYCMLCKIAILPAWHHTCFFFNWGLVIWDRYFEGRTENCSAWERVLKRKERMLLISWTIFKIRKQTSPVYNSIPCPVFRAGIHNSWLRLILNVKNKKNRSKTWLNGMLRHSLGEAVILFLCSTLFWH